MPQVPEIGHKEVDILVEAVVEAKHEHDATAEGSLRINSDLLQVRHQAQRLGPKAAPGPSTGEIDLRHCHRSLKHCNSCARRRIWSQT